MRITWRPRSVRREHGGVYACYAAVYSRAWRARMTGLHARGRHGPLMANGRCTWCGAAVGPARGLA
jgi:hypothetical protein